jgi:hypothetical protein
MRTTTFCLVLAASLSIETAAEPPNAGYATEFKLLAQQRDKALAEAEAPVLRRYKEALQLLQKKVTQAGDLETAMKIKEELAKMGEAPPNSEVSAEGTAAIFIGKKWGWFVGEDEQASRHGVLEFRENGVLIKQGEVGGFLTKWQALPNRMIKVMHNDGGFWAFRYDPAKNEAHAVKINGSKDEHKILRPVE